MLIRTKKRPKCLKVAREQLTAGKSVAVGTSSSQSLAIQCNIGHAVRTLIPPSPPPML